MKKIILILLVLVMTFSLCACGKSEAAKNCETLISAIGEVTLDSESVIVAAEKAYAALTPEEKEQIADSAETLTSSRTAYDELVIESHTSEVVDLIDAVGEVTLDSEEAIIAAEKAYSLLTADEKSRIEESGDRLAEMREAYDAAVQKAIQEEKEARMKENANKVITAIDAIGDVTLDSKFAVTSAREQYNALTAEEKQLVTNYSVLESAETELNALVLVEKEKIIKQYSSRFDISTDKVEGITWYMPNNLPDYIDIRSYVLPYIGIKNNQPWVCIRYNYTGDDWIFWKKITVVTDNERYTYSVNYFDVTRDNAHGDVWEYYDDPLNYNQPLDSYELKMLADIADSSETTVRFQGDDYHFDLTISNADKAAIRDVVTFYSALLG
ncbi:MAG: hypothetical protein IJC94_05440 [Oscillospiraceae bacterium]|nr:hypothetical protein [Oscillospiraceae bacterium]MBQ9938108.1 hypothetical protein [Oscillospiraceae bacterium]